MAGGAIGGLANSSVTISTKMLLWSFANSILLSLMVIRARYFLLTGFLCSTTYFGPPGLAFLHTFLIEM